MVGLFLLFTALSFSYYVVIKANHEFNLLCKAVVIGNLVQVLSTLLVLATNPDVLVGTPSDWLRYISLGMVNNAFFVVGLSFYKEKHSKDLLSIAPLILVYFLLILVRLVNPITISEMHTELRVSGAGKIPFIVIQLRVLMPLVTLALYYALLQKGRQLTGLLFVLPYLLYSFYLGNRGDIFYMSLSVFIISMFEGKRLKKKYVLLLGVCVMTGLAVLSSERSLDSESLFSQGFNRLATLGIAGKIFDGTFPPPNRYGLIANLVSGVPSSVFNAYGVIGQAFDFSPSLGYAAAYFSGYEGTGIAVPICYEFVWWFNPTLAPIFIFIFGLIIASFMRLVGSVSATWALILSLTFLHGFIGMEDMTTQFWPFFSRYVILVSASTLIFRALWVRKSI